MAGGVVLQPPVFCKWGMCPRPPKHPPLHISGCVSESNYVFALLISIPVPCFESINFNQNKLKIKLVLQNNSNFFSAKRPFFLLQIFGCVSVTRRIGMQLIFFKFQNLTMRKF